MTVPEAIKNPCGVCVCVTTGLGTRDTRVAGTCWVATSETASFRFCSHRHVALTTLGFDVGAEDLRPLQ